MQFLVLIFSVDVLRKSSDAFPLSPYFNLLHIMTTAKHTAPSPARSKRQTRDRDRDFLKDCESVLCRYARLGRSATPRRVVEEVLACRAPYYYVSLDHALSVVSHLLCNRVMHRPHKTPCARNMWKEITLKVKEIFDATPGVTLTDCVSQVLIKGDASSYFITRPYALRIYRNYLRLKLSRHE